MPRATPVPDSEEISTAPKRVHRAPRKKTALSEDDTTIMSKAVTTALPVRRKAPRRVVAPVQTNKHEFESRTSVTSTSSRPRRSRFFHLVVVVGALIIGIGTSAVIGLSDRGKIDVAARIQAQSQLVANQNGGENVASQTIPVQNTPVNVPNGGLVPAGAATPAPPPVTPESATTTTTSSEDAAGSSTETVIEETINSSPAEPATSVPETTPEPIPVP